MPLERLFEDIFICYEIFYIKFKNFNEVKITPKFPLLLSRFYNRKINTIYECAKYAIISFGPFFPYSLYP